MFKMLKFKVQIILYFSSFYILVILAHFKYIVRHLF